LTNTPTYYTLFIEVKVLKSVPQSKKISAIFSGKSDRKSLNGMLQIRKPQEGRHDIQHNDSQYNDTQHNDIQHNDAQHNDTQHNDIQHNNK
jgi:hypothetical protein